MSGLDVIADEVTALLAPLAEGLEFPQSLLGLLDQIGVPNGGDPSLVTALTAVVDFGSQCEAFAAQATVSFDAATALLESSRNAFTAISQLTDVGGTADGLSSLGADLAELLVGLWLVKRHPKAFGIGVLLSLIQPDWEQDASPARVNTTGDTIVRSAFRKDRLHPGRIVDLIRDPVAALRAEYGNPLATDADGAALADKLFPRLQFLLSQFGVVSRYGISPDDAAMLGDWAAPMTHALVVYVDSIAGGGAADIGVVVTISPASQGDLGLVFAPFGELNLTRQLGGWNVATQLTAGVDAIAWGRNGPTLAVSTSTAQLDFQVTSALAAPAQGPAHVFGSPTGTRLEIGGAKLSAQTHLSQTAQSLAFAADVTKSTLVISAGDGDGFIASILPSGGLRADFGLGIAWSSDKGLTLSGSAGLEATLPVGVSVAGVTLSSVHVGLRAKDGEVDSELSASLSATIGPVRAAVERIGLAAALTFPEKGGNLGVADLGVGFKPPSGVGLAIDAQGVLTGGGFLSIDPATGDYGGVVQLSLHESITLTGFGLIATHMPDGSRGFSLLVFITADGFEPIPLGFGFMLQGIGGMLGIHRTFDVEVLRSGLKSDSLSQLLFPRDPVANAPVLLHALAASFPIRQGSYLIGLLARITWFTPTLVQMDLALILELGARTRLLVLGRVSALLPSPDNDLIRMNMDTIGVLDFDAGTFEADAALFDSRLAHQFPVTGSAALRARWSGSATFVLAIGGLNPRFAPPAGFPQLTRVTIALCSGRNPQLICDAYFAITANTVQFGSHVSLYAEAFDFSVSGDLGFDALVALRPPHFLIDFHAAVQLKRGSTNLFKVTLDGTLEGPLPLRLAAKATFEILWFSFSVHFDFTLADGQPGQAPPSVALEDQVKAALAEPANWSTLNASQPAHGVALRNLAASSGPVLDPLGQLVVQQQVAPLNTQRAVDTFDGVRVAGAQHFQLVASFDDQPGQPLTAAFAPARYFKMSDDDKLVAPSFEAMDAGVVLGDDKVTFDAATIVAAPLTYDEFVINPPTAQLASLLPPKPSDYQQPLAALQAQLPSGAAARAPVRQVGRARFRNASAAPAATLNPPAWRVVETYGAAASAAPATAAATWSDGQAAIAGLTSDRFAVVPAHEVQAS